MKALFIGGTGTISTEISKLCVRKGWDLTLLNRGKTTALIPEGAKLIQGDINQEEEIRPLLAGKHWDVVADFIAFTPDQVRRDIRLFEGCTEQYFFISSASAYQKPCPPPGSPRARPCIIPTGSTAGTRRRASASCGRPTICAISPSR